jgi:hypothetical protein
MFGLASAATMSATSTMATAEQPQTPATQQGLMRDGGQLASSAHGAQF